MIIKRITAVPLPPPVKIGDKVLVYDRFVDPLRTIAPAVVRGVYGTMFDAWVWNAELKLFVIALEGEAWCRDQEPAASAFRTVVALREAG